MFLDYLWCSHRYSKNGFCNQFLSSVNELHIQKRISKYVYSVRVVYIFSRLFNNREALYIFSQYFISETTQPASATFNISYFRCKHVRTSIRPALAHTWRRTSKFHLFPPRMSYSWRFWERAWQTPHTHIHTHTHTHICTHPQTRTQWFMCPYIPQIFCKGKLQKSMASVVNVAEVLTRPYSRERCYKKSYETKTAFTRLIQLFVLIFTFLKIIKARTCLWRWNSVFRNVGI